MGHFSALAGSAALAVLVIPTVVRTTENMLLLVPNQLREASSALGLPHSLVIRKVAYKAARAGMMTGVLLGHRARQRRNGTATLHRLSTISSGAPISMLLWPVCRSLSSNML